MFESITPLILTYNEAPNIERTLQQLQWASRIVVIDSFSSDTTLEILKFYAQVEVIQREFSSFADQCNFGLAQIQTEWVLSLDADYVLSDDLIQQLKVLQDNPAINGYSVPFKYCVFGKPLRGTLLPRRTVLYRARKATYQEDGHAHRVQIAGKTTLLSGHIYHDDRKSLSRWLWAQDRYMVLEVKKLQKTPLSELGWGDRLRKQKILAPIIIFFYCLILKGGIFDGWHGWYYAFQRVFAETLLSLRLIEADLSDLSTTTRPPQKLN
ncbi:glycosyltransferase family 2 protein [Synechococcus sp. BDU 130192]|uniref:glycosyltransferase family 2 protein n=1 Tax=Synechococcus sp. BDU 130192 TaxID=2042059 RepID=UPI000C077C54|nr:glycosyltransferase family 2 protein [Synechococcus sp. BDU 130192]